MEQRFGMGQIVGLRANRERSGSIIEVLSPAGDMPRYRVFHGSSDVWVYDQDQLVALDAPSASGEFGQALVEGRALAANEFRARLTAARLSHPQVDSLYALHAARIQFIPFQLKPLLRFL